MIVLMIMSFSLSLAQGIDSVAHQFEELPQTTENVANAIAKLGIIFPEYAFRQTVKESGWTSDKMYYCSKLAKKGNNLFGMRKAKKRKTYALKSTYGTYARYAHWIYSVIDYKLWQESVIIGPTEDYKSYLIRRGYAGNTRGYIKSLMSYRIPKNIQNILNGSNNK